MMEANPRFRYTVTALWGEVPEQVRTIENKANAYLLYSEYLGTASTQEFFDDKCGIIGGWSMQYAGRYTPRAI